ncbi:hypothetical protein B566_EDAN008045 [Ephemera danica]|nr:hypothetical protein B566_EDAN008045 [Ephemera danica]
MTDCMIIAVNYEARKFGVTRSMRGDEAKTKCPDIALVRVPENRDKADISKYREAGHEVIDVLCKFSSCVERASIDEAYLDLTDVVDQRMAENPSLPEPDKFPTTFILGYEPSVQGDDEEHDRKSGVQSWLQSEGQMAEEEEEQRLRLAIAAQLVEEIRAAVLAQTGFTCSAGIAHNKPLSKLVCGLHKPAKQTVLPFDQIHYLYSTLPVQKVRSLGGKLGENLVQVLGVSVMADLARFTEAELCQKFDHKTGQINCPALCQHSVSWLYNIARGIDNEPVNARLLPKSIGCCKRFPGRTALRTQQEVQHWMKELSKEVAERLNKDLADNHRRASKFIVQWSVKIGGSSCSKTGTLSSYDADSLAAEAMQFLNKANAAQLGTSEWKPPLQFLGINVSKFTEEEDKATSIQKFFKPIERKCQSSLVQDNETNKSFGGPSRSHSNENMIMKSFFLNYPEKYDVKEDLKVDRKEVQELNDGPSCSSDMRNENGNFSENVIAHTSGAISNECPTGDSLECDELSRKVPCPQCENLVPIVDMSDHLDHHIAEELHKALNSGPRDDIQKPPDSLNAGVSKKRKYTKTAYKSDSNNKTKKIDSFFSHV